MRSFCLVLLAGAATLPAPVFAADDALDDAIVVSGEREAGQAAMKTSTPIIEVPQAVTVVTDEIFQAQGALSISDTLNYVAGVTANPYGPDSRVDGGFVRGLSPLQFRDGMRDIFSYYASIRADPYNFSQVELVRGPASVLFGQGSLGGIVNLVSKTPQFTPEGEVAVRYGTFDRKEAMADITGPLSNTVAARLTARLRDSDSQTDHVPDDRIMLAPSVVWQPSVNTKLTVLGLYQEDDAGSTSQFLPLVGTILPNPNGRLDGDTFIGKPGWDRYDGRLAQGTVLFQQRVGDTATFNAKARYIDSDLTYFTHYPDSYSNPTNPFLDDDMRIIGNISSGSIARMEIFSTDNNVQLDFNTGSAIEHTVLAGIDYSWNHVRKVAGYGYETIDIYDIDYDAMSDFGGGLPPDAAPSEDVEQEQAGFYLQDQIRIVDRVSVVLGVRHDNVQSDSFGVQQIDASATTFRAGIIGELIDGVSPFFSYTESFEPIAGTNVYREVFRPQSGRQYEAGIKFHPTDSILATVSAYDIKQSNRPVSVAVEDPANPGNIITGQLQTGTMKSRGVEFEAVASLPGAIQLIANYSYNEAEIGDSGQQLDNVPKQLASFWGTKTFALPGDASLRLGGGVRHTGANRSYGPAFPDGILTPEYTLVDALAEVNWRNWSFRVNGTNLLNDDFYSACLARGDCFEGADRQVFGTISYNF